MKETVKTIALVVLGGLYVLLALHQPELPKPAEHPVELTPAYIAVKDELAKTQQSLAAAEARVRALEAAAATAAEEKERDAKWSAAVDAEARGALRTAAKLYDAYASSYPGTKKAQQASSKAKKLLAEAEAKGPTGKAPAPAAPASPTKSTGSGAPEHPSKGTL